MTDFSQVMDDYNAMVAASDQLFTGWKPTALTPVQVSRSKQHLGRKELSEALASCSAVYGWLLFSDQKVVLNGQQVPAIKERLLSGELYHDAASVRIAPAGVDRWLWVQTTVEVTEATGASHLATSVTHEATDPSLGKLHYRQLWLRDELGRLRVEDAVFEGFQGA